MNEDKQIFIDTNILVYAYEKDTGPKQRLAKEKIIEAWNRAIPPAISVQVLQEFYVTLIRKKLAIADAKAAVMPLLHWNVIPNDSSLFREGIALQERSKVSFWDAMILAAAKRAKASVVWSEDFNVGQNYDGVKVINPLLGFAHQ